MKKIFTSILLACLLVFSAVALAACGAEPVTVATGSATALVYSGGTSVGYATVVADSEGNVHYAQFEEYIQPVNTTSQKGWAVANASNSSAALGKYTNRVAVNAPEGEAAAEEYAQYIRIGDKIFEAKAPATLTKDIQLPVYVQIGVTGGIQDLTAYLRTGTTTQGSLNSEATKWYVDAIHAKQVHVLRVNSEAATGFTTVKNLANEDVKLVFEANAVGTGGGISKRYSAYGNAGYNWVTHQKLLEDFFVENGGDVTVTGTEDKAPWTLTVGDTSVQSTQTYTNEYVAVLKAAFDKALAEAKA